MISVLIPVYNQLVNKLVCEIYRQLEVENINFEIICLDDASTLSYLENIKLEQLDKVSYKTLAYNIGRSHIRNLLASQATYDWLLFLDADTYPKAPSFIKNYLHSIKNLKFKCCCGGIAHTMNETSCDQQLRNIYSRKRECFSEIKRKEQPYHQLKTANLLIHKSLFAEFSFCESLTTYGYEDLLFFLDLKAKNVPILHIDNPVYHEGMDTNQVFIEKTEGSLKNLVYLIQNQYINHNDTTLLKTYDWLKTQKLLWLVKLLGNIFLKPFRKILIKYCPNLFLLDVYKLLYYSKYC